MTVTKVATPGPTIFTILDSFQIPRGTKGLQAMTVPRIATPTLPSPVTVDTFQTPKRREERMEKGMEQRLKNVGRRGWMWG